MSSPLEKNAPDPSESELADRLAHAVDPRRFVLFSTIRSSSSAVRDLRAQSFPAIVRELEAFRSSVSGHSQFAELSRIPVRIDPNEDRVAFATAKNGGAAVLWGPFMDVWYLLKDEDRPSFLSFVVGHEYGHLVSKTRARGLRYLRKVCTVKFFVSGILGLGQAEKRYRIATRAYHSEEFSSDAFAANLSTELGYDPKSGLASLELTDWLEGNDVEKESFSHPSTKDRIARVLGTFAPESR